MTPATIAAKPKWTHMGVFRARRWMILRPADGVEVRMHPRAEQLYKERLASEGRDFPGLS
jgi:hypothetical protein